MLARMVGTTHEQVLSTVKGDYPVVSARECVEPERAVLPFGIAPSITQYSVPSLSRTCTLKTFLT